MYRTVRILSTVFLWLLMSIYIKLYAQEVRDTITADTTSVQLKGAIVDENQDPVPMAIIRIEGQAGGAMANLNGEYKLSFHTADSVVILYSAPGYVRRRRVLRRPKGRLTLNIVMPSADHILKEVVISDTRRQLGQNETLNIKELRRMPSTTGNAVEDLVATQAGVSTHNELSSQYNVRGGSFDENFVYINGIEIYRPLLVSSGQQEGLSVINSDMTEKVNFSSGGFAAQYGDKMSSVLDITYRKPQKFEGTFAASMLGASVYAGYGNKRVSFANALRYKTNQYLFGTLETKGEYSPNFFDYQAYFSWMPNQRLSLDVIGYISNNTYKFQPKDRETKFGTLQDVKSFRVYFDGKENDLFRTFFGTAKLTYNINRKQTISLSYSAFNTRESETYDIQGQYWLNETNSEEQLGVGTYMEHARNMLHSNTQTLKLDYNLQRANHSLQTGIAWKCDNIKENAREWESRDSSGYSIPHNNNELMLIYNLRSINAITSTHFQAYAQDTWRKESKLGILSINYGLRLSYWSWNNEWLFSPRASLGYVPANNERITFRMATGLYYQRPYYKELRDTTKVKGNTIVRLNPNIKSQRSFQLLAALEYKFRLANRPFKFTAETYYKAQSNINPYNVDNIKVVYYGENLATGYVAGIDFKIYGEFIPGTDSWISLGVMKARMKLNGKNILQPTDQRYNFNFFFSDFFPGSTRWKMNLKASFSDGLPFGPPHTGLEHNVFRAPAYKRIDVGMNYRALNNEDKHLRRNIIKNIWLGIDCFNIFGFNNVSGYYWVTDIMGHQYAVPNYLTNRQINGRILVEF